ncbi:MAG: hypothetical protein HYV09_25085 [Deltaproteobacteria bacterium]|nr:hypothetical protein [Deltaproteobacteria bacterium]
MRLRSTFAVLSLVACARTAESPPVETPPPKSPGSVAPAPVSAASTSDAPAASASAPPPPSGPWTTLSKHSVDLEVADDDALYGVHWNDIVRVAKKGGAQQTLSSGYQTFAGEQRIAVDSTEVYFGAFDHNAGGQRGLFRVAKEGGTTSKLAALDFDVEGIAVDDTRVYLTHRYDGEKLRGIMAVPKKGGKVTMLVANRSAGKVFVEDAFIMWANYDAAGIVYDGNIERMPRKGGAVTNLTAHGPAPFNFIPLTKSAASYITKNCWDTKSTPKPGCAVHLQAGKTSTMLYGGSRQLCYGVGRNEAFVIDDGKAYAYGATGKERIIAEGVPTCSADHALADANYIYWSTPTGLLKLPW